MNRFRVATTLAQKLEELGVSPAEVLRHARLPERLFEQDKIFVSTEELFALYGALTKVSRDPAVGLRLGGERRVEQYDPIALASAGRRVGDVRPTSNFVASATFSRNGATASPRIRSTSCGPYASAAS
jgi:hypothetical protein